jgi:hypothetical protein
MADEPSPQHRERKETVAWLEEQDIVTISAQRVYFEQLADGLAPEEAFSAALRFTDAEATAQ